MLFEKVDAPHVLAKIQLMVGPAGRDLMQSIRNWIAAREAASRLRWDAEVFDLGWQIIEQKQAGITARLAAVGVAKVTENQSVS